MQRCLQIQKDTNYSKQLYDLNDFLHLNFEMNFLFVKHLCNMLVNHFVVLSMGLVIDAFFY